MTDSCESGRISKITPTHYVIQLEETNTCRSCGIKEMCSQKEVAIERNEVSESFELNEPVNLSFEKIIQTSFLLYIVPLIALFAGIIVARLIFRVHEDIILFAIAMAAMTITFFLIRLMYQKLDKDSYTIKIQRKKQGNSPSLYIGGNHAR